MLPAFANTIWKNPTQHPQRFKIHSKPGEEPVSVEILPGKTAEIPSKYDRAIRTERGGVVVGGLAPLLVPEGHTTVPVHEAIVKAAALGDAERKLVEKTGASAGASSLDALLALEAKNAALEAKLEALMAMMAERTAPTSPTRQDVMMVGDKNVLAEDPPAKPVPAQQQANRKG